MKLFGSLRWDGGAAFFYGFKGRDQKFENHCTRASLHSDTVEDLIRISVEGPSLEDVDARESVASWFSQVQKIKKDKLQELDIRGACDCNGG